MFLKMEALMMFCNNRNLPRGVVCDCVLGNTYIYRS